MGFGKKEAAPAAAAKSPAPTAGGLKVPGQQTNKAPPAAGATAPAKAGSPSAEEFFKLGIEFFKDVKAGKYSLPVIQAAAAKVAPAAATAAVKAAAPAPTKAASQPAAKKSPAAPSATSSTSSAASSGSASPTDLASKNRLELASLAKSMGLDPAGKKAEDLRKMILEAGGGAQTGGSEGADNTEEKAKVVMQLIEDNLDTFEAVVDPNVAEGDRPEGWLGCGGDCLNCPNPEGFETPAQQVATCYSQVHEALGIEPTIQ